MTRRLKTPSEAASELRSGGAGEAAQGKEPEPRQVQSATLDASDLEDSMDEITGAGDAEGDVQDDSEYGPPDSVIEADAEIPSEGSQPSQSGGDESDDDGEEDPFLSRLSELGFQDVSDRQEAERRLIEAYEQQKREREEVARQYDQRLQAMESQLRQRQYEQPQRIGQQQPSSPNWLSPPPIDEARARQYLEPEVGEDGKPTGKMTWKANTPEDVRKSTEQYEEFIANFQTGLLTRPWEVLPQIIQQVVAPMIQNGIGQYQSRLTTEQLVNEYTSREAEWLFKQDPVTKAPKVNSQGQYELTPAGEQLFNDWERFAAMGMPEQEALAMAHERRELSMLRASGGGADPERSRKNKETAESKKRESLERGKSGDRGQKSPPRLGGSLVGPGGAGGRSATEQNPNYDLREALLRELSEEGMNL